MFEGFRVRGDCLQRFVAGKKPAGRLCYVSLNRSLKNLCQSVIINLKSVLTLFLEKSSLFPVPSEPKLLRTLCFFAAENSRFWRWVAAKGRKGRKNREKLEVSSWARCGGVFSFPPSLKLPPSPTAVARRAMAVKRLPPSPTAVARRAMAVKRLPPSPRLRRTRRRTRRRTSQFSGFRG